MEIYIEDSFILNYILTHLILVFSGKLVKENYKKINVILASILASVIAILYPLLNFNIYIMFVIKMLIGLVVIFVAFPKLSIKKNLISFSSFILITATFGGLIYFVNNTTTISNYVVLFVLSVVFCCYLLANFIRYLYRRKHIANYMFDVVLTVNNSKEKVKAFLDTGNQVYDIETSNPVTIISATLFKKLYPKLNLVEILLHKKCNQLQCHFMEIGTVGKSATMMIFKIEELCYSNKNIIFKDSVLAGVSFKNFSNCLGCEMILHPAIASVWGNDVN